MAERDDRAGLDRMAGLDPFADAAYAHPDPSAMVVRITTAVPARVPRRRMALVLAPLGAMLTAGIVAAGLAAAPPATLAPLSALSVSTPRPAAASAVPTDREAGTALPSTCDGCAADGHLAYAYVVAGALPASAPSVDAYEVAAPAHPAAVLAVAARDLGVGGAVTRSAAGWSVGPGAGRAAATVSLAPDGAGVLSLRYAAPVAAAHACATATTEGTLRALPTVVVDRTAADDALAGLLDAVGARYSLADPRFETSVAPSAAGCAAVVTLGEQVAVHGIATDQSASVTLSASGRLVGADVPVFSLRAAAPVAVVSAAEAASSLARSTSGALALEPAAWSTRERTEQLGQALSEHTSPRYTDWQVLHRDNAYQMTAVPGDLVTVELTSATIALRAFATSRGTWLLPVYELAGDGYSAAVRPSPAPWSGEVLATTRAAVRLRGVRSNQSRVLDPRVLLAP